MFRGEHYSSYAPSMKYRCVFLKGTQQHLPHLVAAADPLAAATGLADLHRGADYDRIEVWERGALVLTWTAPGA